MSFIPDDFLDDYYTIADEFITNDAIGEDCTIYYPPKRETCPNCKQIRLANGSANVYKPGGPVQFSVGLCPFCGGVGYKEVPATDSIRLRVYWTKKDWRKLAPQVEVPDAAVMTIGFMTDLPKIMSCQYVNLVDDESGMMKYRFILAGEPFPHGFGKNRYFIAYWKRDK